MRLLIVSNRLPFTVIEKEGELELVKSSGGLVTGLSDYLDSLKDSSFTPLEHLWIGWPGVTVKEKYQRRLRRKTIKEYNCSPVFIPEKEMDNFYHGFCNKTIWPLFHCFPIYAEFNENLWNYYKQVNEFFCEAICKILKSDDILWIHDYHLLLLPKLIREKRPESLIGFFLHIPFPPYEIYRLLPKKWRTEILEGLLGADLIGFHTIDYTQSFLRCVLRISGLEHNLGSLTLNNRILRADTFPMGIHYKKFYAAATDPDVQKEKDEFARILMNTKTILSVDRLDYTKGIINRLEGYELFLEENPHWHNKITLLLIVVPSRIGVERYQRIKIKIDEFIGKINGRFGNVGWTPIQYQYKHIPFKQLVALYNVADIALISPLRDGMNLVAKEYIASQSDKKGVLILSEMAGAAKELGEAIIINPNHKQEIAQAIKDALSMSIKEQTRRIKIMQKRLSDYDVIRWAGDFISELLDLNKQKMTRMTKLLSHLEKEQIIKDFKTSNSRIIFLDYDGTLVPLTDKPQRSKPDNRLLKLLRILSEYPDTEVVLVSGRDKSTLKKWFGKLDISLSAEHGVWIKEKNKDWLLLKPVSADWKSKLYPLLKLAVDRLPASFIEEKEFSLVWHYRKSDPELASIRAKELIDDLISLTANIDVQILSGEKVIEIKSAGINKGVIATHFISNKNYEFILAIGDDATDEDMFKVLPQKAYSVTVGISSSFARYNIYDYKEVRRFITELVTG
ncbi:MAG: bifunctional alpha,alpha-trehalose-phosphate synthase (UDP-forming)/trehalose-phosphatase [bacterium]